VANLTIGWFGFGGNLVAFHV